MADQRRRRMRPISRRSTVGPAASATASPICSVRGAMSSSELRCNIDPHQMLVVTECRNVALAIGVAVINRNRCITAQHVFDARVGRGNLVSSRLTEELVVL